MRVEGLHVHLQFVKVDRHIFNALCDENILVHVHCAVAGRRFFTLFLWVLLAFSLFVFILSGAFLGLDSLNELLDEIGVFEHFTDTLKAGLT